MKKGQLLAALALAFALGVVAPVAGVYNSVEAVYAAEARTEADGAEVKKAIDFVEANATYKKIAAVEDAITEYGSVSLTATVEGLQNAMKALNGANINGTDDKNGTIVSAYSNTDDLAALATKAASTTNYNLYTKYAEDMAATEFDIEAVKADMVAFRNAGIVPADTNLATWGADKDVKTAANVSSFLADNSITIANKDKYDALIDLVNNVNDYSKAYDAIEGAISAAVNEAGKTALEDLDAKYTETIANLKAVADNTNITDYTKWGTVISKVTACDGYTAVASSDNWKKVKDLATAYIAAVPVIDVTAEDFAEVMMGYQATDPDTPAVNTIKSADGKVSVTGNIPAGVYVEVSEAKMPENFEGFGELKNAAFDIVLKNADGTVYNVDQTLVVSIAVPEGINGANSDVIYITSMGGTENMKAKYADGFMTFTTNHFSIYAIVERAAGDNGGSNVTPGDTGTVAQAEGTASATGILAGIAAALTAAGAGVVAFRNARRNSKKNA